MPKHTAACLIEWRRNKAYAQAPLLKCTDEAIDKLIGEAGAVGIDAPFGWPNPFVEAVARWNSKVWSPSLRKELQFRQTDLEVQKKTRIWPLSVSADRIALPAMRAMALLNRHAVTDRSGDGKFFEVYPAGSLSCWKLHSRGYKRVNEGCFKLRREILEEICLRLPWLEVSEGYANSSDSLDALIASLTARTAIQGLTSRPGANQIALARVEGWIHLPISLPTLNAS